MHDRPQSGQAVDPRLHGERQTCRQGRTLREHLGPAVRGRRGTGQLLEVQGNSFGDADDASDRRVVGRRCSHDLKDELPRCRVVQGCQIDDDPAQHTWFRVEVARGGQYHHRHRVGIGGKRGEQVERCCVDPVDVFRAEQHRTLCGISLDQLDKRRRRSCNGLIGGRRRVARLHEQHRQIRRQCQRLRRVVLAAQPLGDPAQGERRVHAVRDAGQPAQQSGHRIEGGVGGSGRAVEIEDERAAALGPVACAIGETRLADPRLAAKLQGDPSAEHAFLPRFVDELELGIAAEQCIAVAARMRRQIARAELRRPGHAPRLDALVEPAQRQLRQRLVFEETPGLAARAVRDDDASGRRRSGQALGEVDRGADVSGIGNDRAGFDIADQHGPGSDAHTHEQFLADPLPGEPHRLGDLETDADGDGRIALVRVRADEADEVSVAIETFAATAESREDARNHAAHGLHDAELRFRIERVDQPRRADEIAEEKSSVPQVDIGLAQRIAAGFAAHRVLIDRRPASQAAQWLAHVVPAKRGSGGRKCMSRRCLARSLRGPTGLRLRTGSSAAPSAAPSPARRSADWPSARTS